MALWLAPSNVFTPFSHSLPLLATLSELDDLLLPHHDPLVHRLTSRGPRRPRQWSRSVDLRGFVPNEVSVKREEQRLRVVARHADGEDVTEVKRTVELPDDVDAEKVSSGFTRDGVLLLKAPFKEQPQQQPEAPATTSVWDELRGLLRGPGLEADSVGHVVDAEGGAKQFKAELSVREYKPEEIRVRQQGDCVIVVAEHKEENGGQRIHRRLERMYQLPQGTNLEQVVSKLSHDGRLCIEAPFEDVPPAMPSQLKDVPMATEALPVGDAVAK